MKNYRLAVCAAGVLVALMQETACCGQEPKVVLKTNGGPAQDLAFSPDGKTLAVACPDQGVQFWDVLSGCQRATLRGYIGRGAAVAFSGDGKLVASGSEDGTVMSWDVPTGKVKTTFVESPDREPPGGLLYGTAVSSLVFSPDGKLLASGNRDTTLRLWAVATGRQEAILKGHAHCVWSIAFSPDGKMLASGSTDGTVRLWEVATAKKRVVWKWGRWVRCVAFSNDGKLLAAGGSHKQGNFDKGEVRLWDVTGGRTKTTLKGHAGDVHGVAFSPDGKLLASCSGDLGDYDLEDEETDEALAPAKWEVKLWDVATGRELLTLKGHTRSMLRVAFSPDGKLLAAGCDDGTVRLWSVPALLKAGK